MRRTGEVRRLVSLETVPCGAAIENSHFSPVCSGLLAAVPLGRARRAPRIIRIVGSVLGRDRSRLRPEILLVDDSTLFARNIMSPVDPYSAGHAIKANPWVISPLST